jgi:2-iminoacetate synthase
MSPVTETDTNLNIFIKRDEISRYQDSPGDFIHEDEINAHLRDEREPEPERVLSILAKSMAVETLTPAETATLLNVNDPELLAEMAQTAAAVKRKVYDNRIVTFAPLYMSNLCINNCMYCGFRTGNEDVVRRRLTMDEVRRETEVLAGEIGHKRLIVVYGEHPSSSTDYIEDSIRTIYDVKMKTRHGYGQIRRVNVNAAPLPIDDLKRLHEVGIGTFQVFHETYHHDTYRKMHPKGTVKGDYAWRLYCMHRALDAGVDDVGLGVLFGLYDWRFEVMGLLYHARELEARFGIGPHTVSFPRLEPACNAPATTDPAHRVSDDDFKKLVMVLRLALPYTGLIITARESEQIRRETIPLGCTQTDASTRIGIGSYSKVYTQQEEVEQQFMLGDTRSLEELIGDLASMGMITSFCTAGYRCGRTGECIMDLLRSGKEGKFCKLNAIITFKEWLDDFASEKTKRAGEALIQREIEEVRQKMPKAYEHFMDYYRRTAGGERDLYF